MFVAASPRVWNNLPPSIRSQDLNYDQFKCTLKTSLFIPLIPTVAIWDSYRAPCVRPGQATICNFWIPGTLALRAERQSARMSKITNGGLTRSGTGCFIAVPIWQQWVSKGYLDHGAMLLLPFTLEIFLLTCMTFTVQLVELADWL